MALDFAGLVLRPAMMAFSRAVVATAPGGDPFTARGDFRNEAAEVETVEGYHSTTEPVLRVRLADWTDPPVQDMTLVIAGVDGVAFTIDDVQPDGEGGARLLLKKIVA